MNRKNSRIFSLPMPVGLVTLLFLSTGSIILPNVFNNTDNQQIAQAQTPTSSTVIYVNPSTGSDTTRGGTTQAATYKTITFALAQAQPGTVIQLAPGTYSADTGETFPLALKSGITLRGDDASKGQGILISGGGKYISPTFAEQSIAILADNNTTISGVTVTNTNQRGTGIWVESTNSTVTNSTFTNSGREGVFVTGTASPKIQSNVFIQNHGNGISVASLATGEISNNLFQDTGFGLAIGGKSTPLIAGNQINQNKDGLYISESAKPVLRKNVIQNNTQDGIVITVSALPDLGTNDSPGGNYIHNNGHYDVDNATRTGKILAIGNDIDQKKIFGQVDFVASTVEPGTGTQVAFKDVEAGYWAQGYIQALASQSIIAGFPDGSFKPDEPVTRAQFAAIITKAFGSQAKRSAIKFSDVKSDFWAYQVIQTAYQGQFLSGYPNGTFKPQQQISRVQALVSLSSGLGLTANNSNSVSFYSDASQIPGYATSSIAAATSKQLVVNYPTLKQLQPNRTATRAEVAAFVYQALVNAGKAQAIPSPYLVRLP